MQSNSKHLWYTFMHINIQKMPKGTHIKLISFGRKAKKYVWQWEMECLTWSVLFTYKMFIFYVSNIKLCYEEHN
jgi:hypothetical protein